MRLMLLRAETCCLQWWYKTGPQDYTSETMIGVLSVRM